MRDGDVVFRDVILLALLGFVAIAILLLPHVRPADEGEDAARPPGDLIVEARWPDDVNADVDLWVRAPGDVPVGYSNLSGAVFNLLRDDLGSFADFTGLNFENAYSRGLLPGEYVVNLHLYSNHGGLYPVPVKVQVLRKAPGRKVQAIAQRAVELVSVGQERTVVWFRLDPSLQVAPGSVHDLPTPLRPSAGK